MAFPQVITVLVLALTLTRIQLTSCSQVVEGSVSCNDCEPNYNYTGIVVVVTCDQVKNRSVTITNRNGHFSTILPADAPNSQASTSPNCRAILVGGPTQLYARKQNMFSRISKARGDNGTYSLLTPLIFSKSCHGNCGSENTDIGSSKDIAFGFGFPTFNFTFGLPAVSIGTVG